MSEREETQLRRLQSIWQSKQDTAGVITLISGCLTFCVCIGFLSIPGNRLAIFLVSLMVLSIVSCLRLVSSASKVVQINKLLKPAVVNPEIIEARVTDRYRRF
jgi:hypothetical protein